MCLGEHNDCAYGYGITWMQDMAYPVRPAGIKYIKQNDGTTVRERHGQRWGSGAKPALHHDRASICFDCCHGSRSRQKSLASIAP